MEKISFEIYATEATIKPDDYNKLRIEVDGIELSDLIEAVDDNAAILKVIDVENISEWIVEENSVVALLEYFDDITIVDYLRSKGWEIGNGSDE
ncbi:TPA: hypothetical protein I3599_000533 [Enterobacter cloacae]|nr:hypothetical protein [Enterobacter cloacae]